MAKSSLLAAASILATSMGSNAGVIIDDHFDDAIVTGWKSLGNSLLADHNITEEGSALTSEVIGTEANLNSNRGIISETSFNPLADAGRFTMTFEIVSQDGGEPGANGLFLGLTSSNDTFFRLDGVFSFGLVFYGLSTRTESQGGVSLIINDIGSGGPAANGLILDANPDSIDLTSFQDGCVATITADSTGWAFSVDGVNDFAGDPITISKSGTWADAGTDFDTVFNGAPAWFVLASNQGLPPIDTHTVVYDRIALTAGASSGSNLEITAIIPSLSGDEPTVTLGWNSIAGTDYAVDFSTDLTTDSWQEITDSLTADGENTEFIHELLPDFADLAAAGKVFYRIRKL